MFSGIAAIGFINSNRNVSYAGLGGQLVFMMLSTNHAQRANQHLDRALWLYNKDILFPPGQH
jgi:Tfp pilus assembly ATPase PilU